MDNDISWVNFNIALCSKLLEYEHNQDELIKILIEIENGNPSKAVQLMISGELKTIDPFSFMALIYKYGGDRFLKAAKIVSTKFKIGECRQGDGVPRMAQNAMYFDYNDVKKDVIKKLWKLFKEANSDNITNKSFLDVLTLKNMGIAKLTIGLYYINPNQYMCLDQASREYLRSVLNIDLRNDKYNYFKNFTYDHYLRVLEDIQLATNEPFYEILSNAWKQFNLTKKKPNRDYWLYSPDSTWKYLYDNNLMSLPDENLINNMDIGDVIVVKKGEDRLLAVGEVVSDYWIEKNRSYRRIYYLPSFYIKTPYKMLCGNIENVTESAEWMVRLRKLVQRFGNLRAERFEHRYK